MIETYQQEIIRKKRAARLFWFIVFLFAGFLYFFFQGYYPSINLSLRSLTSTGELLNEPRDIIRSFGIINVSVDPKDSTILLSGGGYANDEKRMTNYGTYSLLITHEEYIPYTSEFVIEKETPYYIDLLTLIPQIRYTRFGTGISHIANISDSVWTAQSESGMILLDQSFSGKIHISSKKFTHIGEGNFLSGTTLMAYNNEEKKWEPRIWSGSTLFIKECKENITLKNDLLWCKEKKNIFTPKGKTLTGVLDIGDSYVKKGDGIFYGENFTKKALFGTGISSQNMIFIQKDDIWYSTKSGSLISFGENNKKGVFTIKTSLDNIEDVRWLEGNLIFIGRKGGERFMIFYDPQRLRFSKLISFPDIALEEMRVIKKNGNIFLKTRGALLFLYHNSTHIEWIIDGVILAFGEEDCLYERDGMIWKASWKTLR